MEDGGWSLEDGEGHRRAKARGAVSEERPGEEVKRSIDIRHAAHRDIQNSKFRAFRVKRL